MDEYLNPAAKLSRRNHFSRMAALPKKADVAIYFGLAHFWQGARGIVGTGVLALIWGTAYYRCGRNLWPTIIAHSVGNTIAFISTYNS